MRPRIRSIKPEALQHRKVGRLSIAARWLWLAMITQADDDGRLVADPGQLRVVAFAYDRDVTEAMVADWLAEIAQTGLIRCYTVQDVPYACFPDWRDHQRINRPTPSKLPAPTGLRARRTHRGLRDASVSGQGDLTTDRIGSGSEGECACVAARLRDVLGALPGKGG